MLVESNIVNAVLPVYEFILLRLYDYATVLAAYI